jgi:hypothetical protein
MSTKPTPVALTAAMLMQRAPSNPTVDMVFSTARLASDLHRLSKGCQRHAIALCNGEWRDGQRMRAQERDERHACTGDPRNGGHDVEHLDREIEAYGNRLDRRIAKLNAQLATLGLRADRYGDTRGIVLRLTATDGSAIPRNGMSDDSWGIA